METIIQWVVVNCLSLITILIFLIFYQTSGTQNVSLKVWEELRKQNGEYRARVK